MSQNTKGVYNKIKSGLNTTISKVKDTAIVKKTTEYISRMDIDRTRIMNYIKQNKMLTFIVVMTVIILFFYFGFIFRRVDRYLSKMKVYQVNIVPLQSNEDVMRNNYLFCDFYVASSYKSFLPCTNYYDYACIEAIQKSIIYGARYIDLDIYNRNFSSCTDPVVCVGTEEGNWHWSTALDFDAVINAIATTAFGNEVSNPTDPLILNLNFNTWGNYFTINKCAETIKTVLGHKLLPNEFAYQGRYSNKNLATTPIKELIDNVIIISTGDIQDTDMDELTNLHISTSGNFRSLTHTQVKDSYDPKELTEFNKKNITRVIPDYSGREKQNYNWYTAYYLGCQIITMNYTKPDAFMLSYIERFSKSSFLLKPYKLRYHPTTIKQPLQQSPKVSFAPKTVTTPFYSITY